MPEFLQNTVNNPFMLGIALALFTFVLEDAATVSGATFALSGNITIWWSLMALYAGIIIGDAGLYLFGRFASKNRWAKNFLQKRGVIATRDKFQNHMFVTIFVARFIPGMRLTLYSACGFFQLPFGLFILATAVASSLWTTGLYFSTYFLGTWIFDEFGAWRWVISLAIIMIVIIVPRFIFRKVSL